MFDSFEENDHFYLVQEYIQGYQLRQELVAGQGWIDEERTVAFLLEVLEILQSVHQEGIVHRDIKPDNLMRRESNGEIVLIDFGAVREIATLSVNSTGEILTTQAIGTNGYMPAEQYNPQALPQPYNDIYALGITAIEAFTGRTPPFLLDRETGEVIWHYSTPDRPAVQVSDGLRNILTEMVRWNFRERYQSLNEILQHLDLLVAQPPLAEPPLLETPLPEPPVAEPPPPEPPVVKTPGSGKSHFRRLLLGFCGKCYCIGDRTFKPQKFAANPQNFPANPQNFRTANADYSIRRWCKFWRKTSSTNLRPLVKTKRN